MAKQANTRTVICGVCGHSRTVWDGAALRRMRVQKGLSLRALATRLSLSAAYLCDVELNRRHAGVRIVAAYRALNG